MSAVLYADVEEALFVALSASSALSDLIEDRLFATFTAQSLAMRPYVVFEAQSTTALNRTPTPELEANYRLSAYAKTRAEAHAVQGILHSAMMNSAFTMDAYRCYAVIWLGMKSDFSVENGQVLWSCTGSYRVRWVLQGG